MPINKIRVTNDNPGTYTGEWTGIQINSAEGSTIKYVASDTVIPQRRIPAIVKIPLSGATIHAGVVSWAIPEPTSVIIMRCILDLTTVSTGAATLDIGYTATTATTASATLLDGIDVNAAAKVFDNMSYVGDATNTVTPAAKGAAAKWITIKEASGDATGLVAQLYIEYFVI